MRSFFFAALAAFFVTCGTAYADIVPTPAPSPGTHLPVLGDQQGCYHNTNGACPAPSPATTAQAFTDYQNLSNHVNYWEGDQRNANIAQHAGIHIMGYMDPGLVHGAAVASYPQWLAAKDQNGYLLFLPNNNSSTGGSLQGDPTNPMAVSYWSTQASQSLQNNFGHYGFSNFFLDDQIAPWQQAQFALYCSGTFVVSGGGNTCATGSTVNAVGPMLNQYAYPTPYSVAWLNGVHNLYNAMPVPVFINLVNMDPTMRAYWQGPRNNNVEAVVCEGCITKNPFGGDAVWNLTNWLNHINSEIVAEEDGVKFLAYDMDEQNTADALYGYASMYLGMLDPNLTINYEEWDSPLTAPTSGNPISNLTYLVPTGAYGPNPTFDPVAVQYNPNTPNQTVGVSNFLTSTGAYAREFSDLYVNGVDTGPCAVVVNPNPYAVAWPQGSLRQTYTHTVNGINSNGVVYEFGDNAGMLNLPTLSGGAPSSTLAANSAVIAVP